VPPLMKHWAAGLCANKALAALQLVAHMATVTDCFRLLDGSLHCCALRGGGTLIPCVGSWYAGQIPYVQVIALLVHSSALAKENTSQILYVQVIAICLRQIDRR
jgi:hypothetical protein